MPQVGDGPATGSVRPGSNICGAHHLGKHEMVQELEIRAELPKTPIGKLSKKDLIADEQRKRAAERAAG